MSLAKFSKWRPYFYLERYSVWQYNRHFERKRKLPSLIRKQNIRDPFNTKIDLNHSKCLSQKFHITIIRFSSTTFNELQAFLFKVKKNVSQRFENFMPQLLILTTFITLFQYMRLDLVRILLETCTHAHINFI